MRYLINIIGPRAVGKTTVLKELMTYLPHYYPMNIDDYRRSFSNGTPKGEMRAWMKMLRNAEEMPCLIVESSGTSGNLKPFVLALNAYTFNIYLTADISVRTQRKAEREANGYQNPPMYFEVVESYPERPLKMKPNLTIDTEKVQPYEATALIIDLLPAEFI